MNPCAARSAEGCQIAAQLDLKRVPGSVRFLVRQSGGGLSVNARTINTTHTVHELFFGPRVTQYQLGRLPAGTAQALHRLAGTRVVAPGFNSSAEHFLRVVPSRFAFRNRYEVSTFQYTSESAAVERADSALPTVSFSFDVSPLGLLSREVQRPVYHLVTNIFAIIGGVFTLAGVFDSVVHGLAGGIRRAAKGRLNKGG